MTVLLILVGSTADTLAVLNLRTCEPVFPEIWGWNRGFYCSTKMIDGGKYVSRSVTICSFLEKRRAIAADSKVEGFDDLRRH